MPTAVKIDDLIRSRRRTISLEITADARLVVRAPRLMPRPIIEHLLREKQLWILRKRAEIIERMKTKVDRRFQHGELFEYLGESLPLQIDYGSDLPLSLKEKCFYISGKELATPAAAFERWYRAQALQYFTQRIEYFAQQHGFQFQKLRLSSAQKRWGSCSSSGTISLSWRLMMAPPDIIDYVIVHELAHLKHMDHSPHFWHVVESILPDYKSARAWLRKRGHELSL